MKTGKIVKWDSKRGFGFIRKPQSGPREKDVFVHILDVVSKGIGLQLDDEVIFDEVCMEKGVKAVNVKVLRRMPAAPVHVID